jgi:formylglycine-generating enzyme required for sulfatase activity
MILCNECGNAVDEELGVCTLCSERRASVTSVAGPSNPLVSRATEVEIEFWESIRGGDDLLDFREYLEHYPNGIYAVIARNRVRKLEARSGAQFSSAFPAIVGSMEPPLASVDPWINHYGIDLVWISPGSFMMGSDSGEADERPVHRITISVGFFIGRYEVTQAQWRAAMDDNPSSFKGNDRPVENVSWNDAQEFISRLNDLNEGHIYRLPTEAEWEYACRAGTTGDFAGNLDSIAWYAGNSGNQTHPVGTRQPNPWGLFDMHGNVSEWCEDFYDEHGYGGSPGTNPFGPLRGEYRVLRGGSWDIDGSLARSATRYWDGPDYRDGSNGLRVVAVRRSML